MAWNNSADTCNFPCSCCVKMALFPSFTLFHTAQSLCYRSPKCPEFITRAHTHLHPERAPVIDLATSSCFYFLVRPVSRRFIAFNNPTLWLSLWPVDERGCVEKFISKRAQLADVSRRNEQDASSQSQGCQRLRLWAGRSDAPQMEQSSGIKRVNQTKLSKCHPSFVLVFLNKSGWL